MSVQIVYPDRYKKTTRKKSIKNKENIRKELRKQEKIQKKIKDKKINESKKNTKKEYSYIKFTNEDVKNKDKISVNINNKKLGDNKLKKEYDISNKDKVFKTFKNNIKSKKKNLPILKVSICIFFILSIGIISRIIVKRYDKEIPQDTATVSLDTGENVSLVQDSILKIGMSKLDNMDINKSRNIVLNEINKLTNLRLIEFDSEYNIIYEVAEKIEKISNKEYLITLNNEYKVNIDEIKKSVEKIKQYGNSNIYYENICKIKDITEIDKQTIKFTLTQDQPYFVYSLDFPIIKENSEKEKYKLLSTLGNEIKFSRSNSKSTVQEITFKKYDDIDNLISEFKNKKIDIFTASSDSIMSLIGKYDYSIKKYRDGKTLFLLGNNNSQLFSMKEVRKAILYSINRDKIITELNTNFIEKIDIPYIYSDIKYKYDTYGVGNVLTSQGWIKESGVYVKKIDDKNVKLEITILVNSEDGTKVTVCEKIKYMLEENGIKVNIKSCAQDDFNNALKQKDYDLVLADIYVNNIPDISFIEEYLKVNDIVSSAINIVKNSNVEELPKNIESLESILSNEVACIGIYATNTNVVYQTNVAGIKDIGYMNIFNNFEDIGKIQSTN